MYMCVCALSCQRSSADRTRSFGELLGCASNDGDQRTCPVSLSCRGVCINDSVSVDLVIDHSGAIANNELVVAVPNRYF